METTRKLATIRQISKLEPIHGADRIMLATIDGWQCVVSKKDFETFPSTCLCVFFEIDSVLPAIPEYAFMESRKYRVKTAKFKKQISQGLALTINNSGLPSNKTYKLGMDVTKLLKVTKYQKPENSTGTMGSIKKPLPLVLKHLFRWKIFRTIFTSRLFGVNNNKWPSFIMKTDEERIQNMPSVLSKNVECYATEKLDGSSATFAIKKKKFYVCSRNIKLPQNTNNIWWTIAKQEDVKKKLLLLKEDIYIQGEIIGEGIQKNKYKLNGVHFRVFNAVNIKTNTSYNYKQLFFLCAELGLESVPTVSSRINIQGWNVKKLLDYSNSKSVINPNIKREGVVIRDKFSNALHKTSFKVVNPHFLLKHGE